MATQLASATIGTPDQPVWRVSLKRYHDMIKAGILSSGDRVELLDGVIVPKMAKNPPHSFVTKTIGAAVAASARWMALPVAGADYSFLERNPSLISPSCGGPLGTMSRATRVPGT